MKKAHLFIIRFILFIYLTSSYLSATHIHTKLQHSYSKCKIHFIIKNLNGADISNNSSEIIECFNCYELLSLKEEILNLVTLKGFNSNAPPKLF